MRSLAPQVPAAGGRRRPRAREGGYFVPTVELVAALARCTNAKERTARVYQAAEERLRLRARRDLRNPNAAEDALQEAYLRAWPLIEQRGETDAGGIYGALATSLGYVVREANRTGRFSNEVGQWAQLAWTGDASPIDMVSDARSEWDVSIEAIELRAKWAEWNELLTDHERSVFELDRSGLSRREIALQLDLSEKGVKKALERVGAKADAFQAEVDGLGTCSEHASFIPLILARTLEETVGARRAARVRSHVRHCTTCRVRIVGAQRGTASLVPVAVVGVGGGLLAGLWFGVKSALARGVGLNPPGAAGAGGAAAGTAASGGVVVAGGVSVVKLVAVAAAASLAIGGGVESGVRLVRDASSHRPAGAAAAPVRTPAPLRASRAPGGTAAAASSTKTTAGTPKRRASSTTPGRSGRRTAPAASPAPAPPAPAAGAPWVPSPDPQLVGP